MRQLCSCTIVSAKSSAIVSTIEPSEKTTLIKRLSDWAAAQGYKVLIFDTKETEADYADFGQARAALISRTSSLNLASL